jgi:hypothetical protein
MTQHANVKKLGKHESYMCPLPHPRPRHDLAFFKDFEAHFRAFGNRDDAHFDVVEAHEDLFWKLRCEESEKRNLSQDDLHELSLLAWFDAIKQCVGKEVQVVQHK